MKKRVTFFMLIMFLHFSTTCYGSDVNPTKDINTVLNELLEETETVLKHYHTKNQKILLALDDINTKLTSPLTITEKVDLLIRKDQLKEVLNLNGLSKASDISKIRYLKGLEIIRILYEKPLALDHHFASVATFNEISNLSNPNHYPEFASLKDVLTQKQGRKSGFNLTSLLENNIYTSTLHSFVSLFSNNSSKQKKQESIKEIECILDFTLRMHNSLNTIYFETAFLQKSNNTIIEELEKLFIDYTKPINYKVALKDCRNNDDWDTVRGHLTNYLTELDKVAKDKTKQFKAHKMKIDLAFPIDRLLQFITQYNSHIDLGTKFYEKFGIMLNSYENEERCATKIPIEYSKLKDNIKTSIEKFNNAYRPVEINGSKMKQVLYGMNEYE